MSDDLIKELGDVTKLVTEMKSLVTEQQAANDKRLAEIEAKGVADPLTVEKQQKIEARLAEVDQLKSVIDRIEAQMSRPSANADKPQFSAAQRKHADAFEAWLRNPGDEQKAQDVRLAAIETKDMTSLTTSGGHAIPEIIGSRIQETLQLMSPMRSLLNVITVGSSDYKELVDVNGEDGGWVGETDTRTATGTPSLEQAVPTFGEVYAYPKIYEHILDDSFFDVRAWLMRKIALTFARLEGIAWISGNGTNKPTGFLNGTPVATGDFDSPARAFQALQYLPTGVAANFQNDLLSSPAGDPFAVFVQAIHAMRPMWRQDAQFVMNTTTKGILRRFRNSDGDYLLRGGIERGEGGEILGYGITEMDHMPDVAANAFPVAFGNFPEAYLACERTSMRITIDDNITAPGSIKFYARKRVGGIVRQDQAIKLIKCAVS